MYWHAPMVSIMWGARPRKIEFRCILMEMDRRGLKYKNLLMIKGDKFDEDKYVFKYMADYGIQNVRGGCFSQVVLPDDKIKMIETILTGVDDRCFNCGEPGHFVNDCPLNAEDEQEDKNDDEWIWGLLRSMYNHFKQECFPKKTNDYVELNDLSEPM